MCPNISQLCWVNMKRRSEGLGSMLTMSKDLHLVFLSAKKEMKKKDNSITINEASANFVFLRVFHILVCR